MHAWPRHCVVQGIYKPSDECVHHSEFKLIESTQLINLDRNIGHILQLTFKYKIKITAQDALVHQLMCRVLKVADKVPRSLTNHVVHLKAMSSTSNIQG